MDKIMVVCGYQLDVYCRNCTKDASFCDTTKARVFKEARRQKWVINQKQRTAVCSDCVVKRSTSLTPDTEICGCCGAGKHEHSRENAQESDGVCHNFTDTDEVRDGGGETI